MEETNADYFLSYFEMLEDRMIEFQKIIPFCHEHKNVHSPVLTDIINESCNLLDSLFYACYDKTIKEQPNIWDYKDFYNPRTLLHSTRTILLITPPSYCTPFQEWSSKNIPLKWWNVNNKLKHERVDHIKDGSYISAIHTLCALHQSIVKIAEHGYSPVLGKIILRHQWIKCIFNPEILIKFFEGNGSLYGNSFIIETKLFATPMGYSNFSDDISNLSPAIFNTHNSRLSHFLGKC